MRSVTTLAAAEQPWFPPLEGRLTDEAAMAATSTLVRYENPMEIRERGAVTRVLGRLLR
jgi:hypothetical protein